MNYIVNKDLSKSVIKKALFFSPCPKFPALDLDNLGKVRTIEIFKPVSMGWTGQHESDYCMSISTTAHVIFGIKLSYETILKLQDLVGDNYFDWDDLYRFKVGFEYPDENDENYDKKTREYFDKKELFPCTIENYGYFDSCADEQEYFLACKTGGAYANIGDSSKYLCPSSEDLEKMREDLKTSCLFLGIDYTEPSMFVSVDRV